MTRVVEGVQNAGPGKRMTAARKVVAGYGSGRVSRALLQFLEAEAAGGVVMLGATALALAIANSALAGQYDAFRHAYAGVNLGEWRLDMSLEHWINDGLMAVFFFLVGLEIKRELLFGELNSPRRAALPVLAAIGGATLPAMLYLALNAGGEHAAGWGVPMATDIAFAVTLLALLGSRAPLWLKSFVVALAIVDDILAVLVIAFFYSGGLDLAALAWAGAVVVALCGLNLAGVMRPGAYVAFAVVLWYFVLLSGVHATIAGVVAAACVPASRKRGEVNRENDAENTSPPAPAASSSTPSEDWELVDEREAELEDMADDAAKRSAPLYRLEHAIHPWSAFVILPIFAFANAGVGVSLDSLGSDLTSPLSLGIITGLFVGKQAGITGTAWLAVRLGIARLPEGARWRQLWGGAALGGIGFTMSIFIASLAFPDTETLDTAKLAILVGSVAAAGAGLALLARSGPEAG